jgi:hypothetical protein
MKTMLLKDMADFNIGIANVFQKKNAPDSAIYYAKMHWILPMVLVYPMKNRGVKPINYTL